MPNRNGQGPMGAGSGTGRGQGLCRKTSRTVMSGQQASAEQEIVEYRQADAGCRGVRGCGSGKGRRGCGSGRHW